MDVCFYLLGHPCTQGFPLPWGQQEIAVPAVQASGMVSHCRYTALLDIGQTVLYR